MGKKRARRDQYNRRSFTFAPLIPFIVATFTISHPRTLSSPSVTVNPQRNSSPSPHPPSSPSTLVTVRRVSPSQHHHLPPSPLLRTVTAFPTTTHPHQGSVNIVGVP
ncbi:hypothetical protein PIB30_084398 [Stylosanthes scabra]|uniref:Uncharacterized protein n=1 Tax=Stylosanthes scabra TaxID=79078 RepID=A0ABU6TS15_9FABA|nr:hypothetical protein [Stylosanthes scabra]